MTTRQALIIAASILIAAVLIVGVLIRQGHEERCNELQDQLTEATGGTYFIVLEEYEEKCED